jgi:hypothetical protein
MKPSTAVVAIALIVAALVGIIVYRMMPDRRDDCIQPPKLHSEEQTAKANDLANKLKASLGSSGKDIDSDSQFKAAFSDALKYDYDKLSDENVTFLLFSQAIYCYLKLGTKAGDREAEQYTQMLYDRHRQTHGVQGAGEPLTAGEKAELESSPYGAQALKLLNQLPK